MNARVPTRPAAVEDAVPTDRFLTALGARVRQGRTRRGMSRRALAERADVSERYLAQLEAGAGNASIRVLLQLAAALGMPVTDLLDDAAAGDIEYQLLLPLLRTLPPARLGALRHALRAEQGLAQAARSRRIALLGLRGAGKSTLGARLAAHDDVPFIELDREIERRSGTPLEELFLLYGQATYRRHELRCLEDILASHPACVIATGGSLVAEPAAYSLLLSGCVTVWLRASPEEHMARVIAQGDLRPMAGNREAMDDLRRILAERSALYAQADLTLDTAGRAINEAFADLIELLDSHRTSENP